MNRRQIMFAGLLGGAAATAKAETTAVARPMPIIEIQRFTVPAEYRGFKMHWTGWKSSFNNAHLAGQLLAYGQIDGEDGGIYVGLPGSAGVFRRGEVFNIASLAGQELIGPETPDSRRDMEIKRGLDLLKFVICMVEEHSRDNPGWMRGPAYDPRWELNQQLGQAAAEYWALFLKIHVRNPRVCSKIEGIGKAFADLAEVSLREDPLTKRLLAKRT